MNCKKIIFLLIASALVSSCGPKAQIPPKEMSSLLEDLFLADQYIDMDNELSTLADTTLVYAPIIEEYGYSVDDFNSSIEFYRHNPKIFVSILQKVKESIDVELFDSQTEFRQQHEGMEEISLEEDDQKKVSKKATRLKHKLQKPEDVPLEKEFVIEQERQNPTPTEDQNNPEPEKEKKTVKEKKLSKKELKELKNKWD